MAVCTVFPRHSMSRGNPTLTESNRAICSSRRLRLARNGLEPRRGLVLRFEAVAVAVPEPPLVALAAEDVRHAIAPLRYARDGRHALAGIGLDFGHEEHVPRHDGRDVFVAHAAALELPSGPVPALLDRFPASLVAAPAEEACRVRAVGIKNLDRRS